MNPKEMKCVRPSSVEVPPWTAQKLHLRLIWKGNLIRENALLISEKSRHIRLPRDNPCCEPAGCLRRPCWTAGLMTLPRQPATTLPPGLLACLAGGLLRAWLRRPAAGDDLAAWTVGLLGVRAAMSLAATTLLRRPLLWACRLPATTLPPASCLDCWLAWQAAPTCLL